MFVCVCACATQEIQSQWNPVMFLVGSFWRCQSHSNSVIFSWNSVKKVFSYQKDFFLKQETEDIVEAAETH